MAYERDLRLAALNQVKAMERIADTLDAIYAHLTGKPLAVAAKADESVSLAHELPLEHAEGDFDGKK